MMGAQGLKAVLSRLVTHGWALGFRLLGSRQRASVAALRPHPGERISVIAPHPDDEIIGCVGAILRHKQLGSAIQFVFISDGRASRSLDLPAEQVAAVRHEEAVRSSEALGAAFDWIGLKETEWLQVDLGVALTRALSAFRPDCIYAPSCLDFHPEHVRVAQALAHCLQNPMFESRRLRMRIYQIQVPLTATCTNLVHPMDDLAGPALIAMRSYASQAGNHDRALRLRRYTANYFQQGALAEAYWELSALDYVHLHSSRIAPWSASTFRGLRGGPWSDPLAYLQGRGARMQLRQLASDAGQTAP
jgi:LmbE family N-acetylglucosaminyl deacetylase